MSTKSGDIKINVSDIPAQLGTLARKVGAYRVFIFFLVVASLYGYIIWRINAFNNAPADSPSSQAASKPHIDPDTVAKIHSLQDNSVSVQSLFVSARQNPFNE